MGESLSFGEKVQRYRPLEIKAEGFFDFLPTREMCITPIRQTVISGDEGPLSQIVKRNYMVVRSFFSRKDSWRCPPYRQDTDFTISDKTSYI